MSEDKENKIVVLNRGRRAFTTSAGVLPINGTIEIPEAEAKALIDGYDGELIDASKYVPASSKMNEIKKENEQLKAENAKLKEQIEKLSKPKKVKEVQ